MKKAVISILGIQNPGYNDEGIPVIKDYEHQASYYFSNNINEVNKYYNTLPLLIKTYSTTYEIIPIYTELAGNFNKEVLQNAKLSCEFNDEISLIKDELDYLSIFTKIDVLVNSYDEVIIDLTHGFRHLPILAIIDIVIQNFNNSSKISHILFAKEIIKHTPIKQGEYEIVDLKEYLDIANISYVLSSFQDNYTVSKNIRTSDKDFQVLISILSKFSEHILANSLITLLNKKDSLVEQISGAINIALEHPKSKPLTQNLLNTQKHLEIFIKLKNLGRYEQLFELAKIMYSKGYYLNSITLLNEAISWYCAFKLCDYSSSFLKKYENLISRDSYKLTSSAKNIVKFSFIDKKYENKLNIVDIENIQKNISRNKKAKKFVFELLAKVDRKRNNLAHANSHEALKEISDDLQFLFNKFNTYCMKDDVLKLKK